MADTESLYDAPDESESMSDEQPQSQDEDKGQESGQLVNLELCPDAEVGEVLKVKVIRKLDKELEIQFESKDEEGGEKPPEGMEGGEPESETQGASLME